jgi:hypothetical protein
MVQSDEQKRIVQLELALLEYALKYGLSDLARKAMIPKESPPIVPDFRPN